MMWEASNCLPLKFGRPTKVSNITISVTTQFVNFDSLAQNLEFGPIDFANWADSF